MLTARGRDSDSRLANAPSVNKRDLERFTGVSTGPVGSVDDDVELGSVLVGDDSINCSRSFSSVILVDIRIFVGSAESALIDVPRRRMRFCRTTSGSSGAFIFHFLLQVPVSGVRTESDVDLLRGRGSAARPRKNCKKPRQSGTRRKSLAEQEQRRIQTDNPQNRI